MVCTVAFISLGYGTTICIVVSFLHSPATSSGLPSTHDGAFVARRSTIFHLRGPRLPDSSYSLTQRFRWIGLSPCSPCMTVCTVMHAFSLEPSCRFHRNLTPAYLSSSMEYGRDSTYRRAGSWYVLPRSAFQATTSSHSRPSIIPAPVSATQRFEVLAISSLSLSSLSDTVLLCTISLLSELNPILLRSSPDTPWLSDTFVFGNAKP